MITGKLSNGYEYTIKDKVLRDYNFQVALSKWRNDPYNFSVFDAALDTLLDDSKVAFVESFMDENGVVPIEVLMEGFSELINDAADKDSNLKN